MRIREETKALIQKNIAMANELGYNSLVRDAAFIATEIDDLLKRWATADSGFDKLLSNILTILPFWRNRLLSNSMVRELVAINVESPETVEVLEVLDAHNKESNKGSVQAQYREDDSRGCTEKSGSCNKLQRPEKGEEKGEKKKEG